MGGISVVAIGASTGGVEALTTILSALPPECPPVLITQHMPATFTGNFAARLNGRSALAVREAGQGESLHHGHAYLAPGDFHLEAVKTSRGLVCRLSDGPAVSGHRPSVDVLFRSVAAAAGKCAVGVVLTGMGRDGALGLKEMRAAGARTLGQDEASCVVYGMPRAARQEGAVELEMPIDAIASQIVQLCSIRPPAQAFVA